MAGYKAAEWGEQSFMWEGRLRIVDTGGKAVLKLEVSPTSVELEREGGGVEREMADQGDWEVMDTT